MAVNHADGTLFFSLILYPLAAGKAALEAHAGWWAVLFIVVSIPFGIAVNFSGRKLVYSSTHLLMGQEGTSRARWIQCLLAGPVLLTYFFLPLAIVGAGLWATWFGTLWAVRHLL